MIQRFETASFVEADDLPESLRGAGGYGSTGGFLQATTPGTATDQTEEQTPEQLRAGGTTT